MSNALPEFSDTFVPAIEEAARGCKVLYIVAQPQLSRIPFAALSFRDGSPLVSRCAVASAPSATSLKLLLSRPKALGARTCLAIGVGSEAHYRFEDQAKAIRALGGWEACDDQEPASSKEAWLPPPLLNAVFGVPRHRRPRHIRRTGLFAAGALGWRTSYRQRCFLRTERPAARRSRVSECVRLWPVQSRLQTETSGFGAAFLRAGARSVIAAVGYIEPGEAQELAVEFFRRCWEAT